MKKVSIIGFGRFGKTLVRLLQDDFNLVVFDKNKKAFESLKQTKKLRIAKSLQEVYESDVVFYAVPISSFENVIKTHKKHFKDGQLLIDVLSVKVHPKNVFEKYLKGSNVQALLTHPMFGPDSSKDGFEGLPIVIDRFLTDKENYPFWKEYFRKKGLKIVEMKAREHDQLAANSQGVTHFLGRVLESFKMKPTSIDTTGVKKLQEIIELTCNDTWQLFRDLQQYNSYTKRMRVKIGRSYDSVYNKLLPKRIHHDYLIFGIQGGVGSFNQQALGDYVKRHTIRNYKTKYLYTTERVLREVHKGNVDYGLFAIHNSVGGIVEESVRAMSRYKFEIVEEFAIKIQHHLMIRKDATVDSIDTIMAHPQVLKQCKTTLKKKFLNLKQRIGSGDLIDTAKAAEALSKEKLPSSTAILGPKGLSTLYNLEIIVENLQDDMTNHTSFLLVEK